MSIASSVKNKSIDNKTLFIGDVGLTGELKSVPSMEMRMKEASRMGYKTIYTPILSKDLDQKSFPRIEIRQRRRLSEVIEDIL